MHSKHEDWNHTLMCDLEGVVLDKRVRSIDEEISIRRIVRCKNKEKWQKIGVR
jgi:hypothetical protein